MKRPEVTLLVIDDDYGDVQLLLRHAEHISKFDVSVLTAGDSTTGLGILAELTIDVVLLDYSLGAENGLTVLEAIRASGRLDVPVVFLTGQGDEEVAAAAMRAGAVDYMPKASLSTNSLERMLTNAIERRDLERLVRSHRENLERTNVELSRRNREIESFYHTVSHELKTPLAAIHGVASVLADGIPGPVNDDQRECLELTLENCVQMKRCIEDLLDVTRLETGKLSLQREETSLGGLVDHALLNLASAAEEAQVVLRSDGADELPQVDADPTRVGQVLRNLISNALKFTPPGGEIRVSCRPDAADPTLVSCTVADTGRGIPEEHIHSIFERLHQVRQDDYATAGGLGLGLSICKELVSLHGGQISVESSPGSGAAFTFTLPIHDGSRAVANTAEEDQ